MYRPEIQSIVVYMARKEIIAFSVILVLALALRIVFCAAVVGFHAPIRGDEIDYHTLAVSLSEGEGFKGEWGRATARRPPLYPLLLSGAYLLFGPGYQVGRALQILLGVLVVALTYMLGKRLFSSGVSLLAAAIAAFNPFLIFISGYLLTENLYICLLLTVIILVVDFFKSPPNPKRTLVFAGLLAGLCSLARPTAFIFSGFLCLVIIIWGRGGIRERIVKGAMFAAAVIIVIFPWSARNRAVLGETVIFTTHGGHTFYQGNNELVYREPRYRGGVAPLQALPEWDRIKDAGEVRADSLGWGLGLEFVKENPGKFMELAVSKFARTWRFRTDVGLSGVKSGWWWDKSRFLGRLASSFDAGLLFSVVIIPLFILGIVTSAGRYVIMTPLYGILLAHTLVAVIFFGSLRMRIPAEPVIALFAAAGFRGMIERIGRRLNGSLSLS